jgi:hypothetical protein
MHWREKRYEDASLLAPMAAGAEAANAPFIFAKFDQGRQNAGTWISGLGLERYLTKLTGQTQMGTLTAESRAGRRAAFVFSEQVAS